MEATSKSRWSLLLLILLVFTDVIFMGVEILYSLGYAGDYRYSLGADRGYAEVYGYIKLFWIILIFSWLTFQKYQPIYIVGVLLFGYLLLDDSVKIHETVGEHIVEWVGFTPAFGLRAKDFGELAVSASAGLFFLITGWMAYRHSNATARSVGLCLLAGIAGLAFFGVGADILHQLFGDLLPWIHTSLVILEAGGELLVISILCWFSYSLARQELSLRDIHSPLS